MSKIVDFTEQFDRCLINEPSFCTAACPFGLDARTFTEKIKQNRISAACKQYRDAVVFPEIVSRLCDRPCEKVCPLGGIDNAIDLIGLERFVTETAGGETPSTYNLPPRGKRVAIVGGGLSGLACALKLIQKKYDVTIFESASAIEDWPVVEYLFRNETCQLRTGKRLHTRGELTEAGFDAIYVATGESGEAFGLPVSNNNETALPALIVPPANRLQADCANSRAGVSPQDTQGRRGGLRDLASEVGVCLVAGGALVGNRDVYAIADGIFASAAIDDFFRTGVLRADRTPRRTNMILAPIHLERYRARQRRERNTAASAADEAERCLGCRCDACMVYDDLLSYTGKQPMRVRDEVFATTLPGKAEVKATPAKRLINMSNLSGVFEHVCPMKIDLDGLLLAGRQSMHRQNKMPWAFHEFWLRDMAHANGESAAIVIDTKKEASSASRPLAFFPGCQLGAASPLLLHTVWDELLSMNKSNQLSLSGLILRCCGAPAEWAGDEALISESVHAVREAWQSLGRPALACACPSCMRILARNLPEIETVSLYEILPLAQPKQSDVADAKKNPVAVFDPCASAQLSDKTRTEAMQKSVRDHTNAMGFDIAPLPVQQGVPRCCGYGGQPECAAPDYVRTVRENRAAESELPYLCYCMNCREAFLKTGKNATHILELRYPDAAGTPPELSPSKRRRNRENLAAALKRGETKILHCAQNDRIQDEALRLRFADGVLLRMDEDKILAEDVRAVIAHIRHTRESVLNPETGVHSGSLLIGRTTYWVCFTEETGEILVTSVYMHRLAIEREAVWAGLPAAKTNPMKDGSLA